ncbi:hypothetical protein DUI87_20093 [Hirundo rustica rustica]|uniref:Uncharacterized protein n=1 Tax=Hirundo rustica rustica TaxID=333673 RepID=A0A3M0JVV4_HIRRU|nr:hypothetical protein DUI87_20093 [Hirundo rustica rustica]
MFFKTLLFLGLIYNTKLHCVQASLEEIPDEYVMLAIVLPLEQSQAAPGPSLSHWVMLRQVGDVCSESKSYQHKGIMPAMCPKEKIRTYKVVQMDQKLDDILSTLQAQLGDQPPAQMLGPATPPVRHPQRPPESPAVNQKM